jgi:hypothetical protein
MSKRDADQLVTELRKHFKQSGSPYTVELRSGHWHVLTESGASLASFGTTPSDSRFRRNTVSQLRRRGIVSRDFR